jgi:hypothetical protein
MKINTAHQPVELYSRTDACLPVVAKESNPLILNKIPQNTDQKQGLHPMHILQSRVGGAKMVYDEISNPRRVGLDRDHVGLLIDIMA